MRVGRTGDRNAAGSRGRPESDVPLLRSGSGARMKTPPSVRQLPPAEFERWDQLTVLAPEGSIYQTTPYLSALCEATGGRFRVLGAFQGDELLGGVALYEESSHWGTVVSPRLLLYYNGLVVRPHESPNPARRASRQLEVQRALESRLCSMRYGRVCLKSRSPLQDIRVFQERGWRVVPTYTYVAPLGDIPALWQRVDQNLRRLVTRCDKDAVAFSEDEDFESFFRMHLDVHRRKGAPLYLQQPQFERYFRQLKSAGLCRLYQARLPSGQSIAAQLVLTGAHPVSHTVCAASDGEFLSMGASAFLRWKSFEALAALGYAANDLTDAALNPVSRFKSQLGADLELCLQIARPDSARLRLRDGLAGAKRLAGGASAAPASPAQRVPRPMTGYDLLCRALEALGVDHVFGLPGSQNVALFEALRCSKIRTVVPVHELAAAFMAIGFSRASGRLGVLTTIPGPGFTFAMTGLAEARLDSVPLLHIVQSPADEPGRLFQLQAIDQAAIAGPVVKAVLQIRVAADVPRVLVEAYDLAMSGEPGPVLLEVDPAALAGAVSGPSPDVTRPAAAHPAVSPEEVAAVVQLLGQSRRPILLVGQGGNAAAGEVRDLAERLSCPVLTSTSGRGVVPEDHPLAIPSDLSDVAGINALIAECDLVLALGIKFSHNGARGFQLQLPAERLVHVDASRDTLGANYPAHWAIQADVGAFVSAVLGSLSPAGPGGSRWSQDDVASWRRRVRSSMTAPVEPKIAGADPPTPARFFESVRQALPADACLVTDSGWHQMLARRHYSVQSPRGLLVPTDFQSMSFGLPAAIGAKLAAPDRPVVALTGDGGLLMAGMDLVTAARESICLPVIVLQRRSVRSHQVTATA